MVLAPNLRSLLDIMQSQRTRCEAAVAGGPATRGVMMGMVVRISRTSDTDIVLGR
jgi:hypothetical protein